MSVSVESDTNSYYLLNGGAAATGLFNAVDIGLGASPFTVLTDGSLMDASFFYHVARNALASPQDTDEDGIDDVFELRLPAYLDALDAADALEDADMDTVSNVSEYERGTDLTDPLSINTSLFANVDTGHDALDGLAPLVADGHGPKQTVQAAIEASISGDNIHVAGGGSAYVETVWDSAGKDLALVPSGTVEVTPQ